jgi:hypothetical protein
MKKLIRFAVVLLMVVIADASFANIWEVDITYYYDDTFATYTGEYDTYCDGSTYSTGTVGSWRIVDKYSCSTGDQLSHRCQQTDGMGGWITLACPF